MENASRGPSKSAVAALALFTINAYITSRLFGIEYLDEMWSIEGVYIGLARYIREHLFDLNWFPLWYGGIPYQYSYPPLLHFIVAAVATLGHLSNARAYHLVVATLYCLGPVALFWTARRFGASRAAAFLAGLIYSVVSPSCFLVRDVRLDAGGWFGPRVLRSLVHYGDGPHVAGLVLLTFAAGVLHLAMEKRRPIYYVGAAVTLAAVVLTNWLAAFALALAVVCYLISGFGTWPSRWLRVAGVACLAYALAMPWITPATIQAIQFNAPKLVGFTIGPRQFAVAAGFIVAIAGCAWTLPRLRSAPPIRFAVLFFLATAAITLSHFWANFDLAPQANRYDLEMSLAACLAVAFLLDRTLKAPWRTAAISLIVLACLPLVYHAKRVARGYERPLDVRTTAEYEISSWFGDHMPATRVFAPGSIAFWMTAFSDTPELKGGFDNGIRNPLLWGVIYQIEAGDKPEIALAWLKAFGCQAIVGGDPGTREAFHVYPHPERLHGLPELWRDGPEVIYEVPGLNHSLAHAMRAADLPQETPPNYDIRPLQPYLAALDDPTLPAANFQWRGRSAATVDAVLRPEQLLSIQISWDQGWQAGVNGQPRPIYADKLGQIVVEPGCNGACTVDLSYNGGAQMRVARVVSWAALAGSLFWIFALRRR